jgi:hypothetical protein
MLIAGHSSITTQHLDWHIMAIFVQPFLGFIVLLLLFDFLLFCKGLHEKIKSCNKYSGFCIFHQEFNCGASGVEALVLAPQLTQCIAPNFWM